ncbi:MAG: epoxide hydrolase family protein [Jiangellaceae bacterium]
MPTSQEEAIMSQTFTIDVPQTELDDLRDRLARVRWPNTTDDASDQHGVPVDLVRRLVEHWRDGYDWRRHEADLNRMAHGIREVRGLRIHHLHERADRGGRVPAVLLHGWPDSFYRYHLVVPRLVAAGHDVVVPSLPGYTFSDQPDGPMTVEDVAEVVHELVVGLGYDRYAAHGGDWGSAIAERLALTYSEAVLALHLTDVPYQHQFMLDRAEISDAERAFLEAGDAWAEKASYFTVQSSDPTTLAYGLSDSPVGLAAWLLDKFRAWSDREPDLDQAITQVMLYWHTNTIRSSMRLYAEGLGSWDDDATWGEGESEGLDADSWSGQHDARDWAGDVVSVPSAFALFPHDIGVPPREYAERFFAVERFTLMPRGGHFGALEEPELLAEDLIAFLASLDVK